MRRAGIALFLFLTLCFAAITSGAQPPNPNTLIPQLAAELNLWRLSLGLTPLVYNPTLEAMAAAQADYLMSLSSIPAGGAIHTGRRGEDARARSQFAEFAWPTYGHPQRIAVTEIAAIGSIRSALGFWQTSDIHRRSATNPVYREVGIAARQRGSDVLFIVVLGAAPNVLPALSDPEVNEMYLTTERSDWLGDWIGAATRYRLLDADQQVLREWQDWQITVPLPENYRDTHFYVEYEDAAGRRTVSQVSMRPVWSSAPPPPVVMATNTPAGSTVAGGTPASVPVANALPTSTPTPLPTPTAVPTNPPGSITLVYLPRVLTIIPNGAFTNLSGLSLRQGGVTFEAVRWERVESSINISALPGGHCLQIWERGRQFAAPPQCTYVRSIVFQEPDALFWASGTFEVLHNGSVVATCDSSAGQCDVTLP